MSASDVKNESFLTEFRRCLDEHKASMFCEQSSAQIFRLDKTELEVEPQMILHARDGFYEGARERAAEYRPIAEFGGLQKTQVDVVVISSKELFREEENGEEAETRWRNRQLRIALVGQAGSGKTTIINRFARDATFGEIPQIQDADRLVVALDCRDFEATANLTVPEFFFDGMGKFKPSDVIIEAGYNWMLKNPRKVTFVVDALDTLRFTLKNKYDTVQPHDTASPAAILYNLFTGNLFKESRVLSSSREFAIRKHKNPLRADRVVSLAGLSHESIRKLTVEYLGEEKGQKFLKIMDDTCPGLKELCETPVFLIFVLVGLHENEQGQVFIPTTMSGVMINLLNWFLHSEHAHQPADGDVMSTINKMKDLSLFGMKEGKVQFTEADLRDYGLTVKEISNLAIIVPGKIRRRQQILEFGSVSYFAHQTIQEIFCCLKIIEMGLKEFKKFIRDSIHNPQYIVVRRMVSGVLMNTEVFTEARQLLKVDSGFDEKRAIFKESLSRLFPPVLSQDNLQLLHIIHECGDGGSGIIPPVTDTINLNTVPLMTSDMLALGTSTSHCSSMKKIDISACNLSNASVELFSDKVQNSKVKVRRFYVAGNRKVSKTGLQILGRIVKNFGVEKFDLSSCDLNSEDVDAFTDGLGDANVKKINVSGDPFSVSAKISMSSLRKLIPKVTKRLDLVNIAFTPQEKEEIQGALDGHSANLKINLQIHGQKVKMFPRKRQQSGQEMVKTTSKNIAEKIDPQPIAQTLVAAEQGKDNEQSLVIADGLTGGKSTAVQLGETVQSGTGIKALLGPDGGRIQAGESTITFPKNAFDKEVAVQVSLTLKASNWPEGFSRVALVLDCDISGGVLQEEAEVKLKTSCVADEDEALVCVLRQQTPDSAWQLDQLASCDSLGFITFKARSFSGWTAAVYNCVSSVLLYLQRRFITPYSVRLVNLLYYNDQASVACVVCLETQKEEAERSLKQAKYRPLLPIPRAIVLKPGSRIQISLKCMKPEGCSTGDPLPNHVLFTDRITNLQCDQVYFNVDPTPRLEHRQLEMEYSIETDRVDKFSLKVSWPPLAVEDNYGNAVTYVYHLHPGGIVGNIITSPTDCVINGGQA